MNRKSRYGAVLILLSIQAGLVAFSATRHSPNLNEPAHLIAGISHWQFGRFELYRVNPPLVRMFAALPILFTNAECDWDSFTASSLSRPVFPMGKQFVMKNGEHSMWFFTLARWACLPFVLLGGVYCYRWSRELYGDFAGLMALSLWTFSPNILAHGQCINPDCGATSLGLISAYYFWRWLRDPNWKTAILAGITLGGAELTKTTWIILFGLYPLIWLLAHFHSKVELLVKIKRLQQLTLILILGLYILNLGYGFEGSFTQLKKYTFVSHVLTRTTESDQSSVFRSNRFEKNWLGKIPVPLPKNYLLGIDVQKKDFEEFQQDSYLRGEFQPKGWWYYYLYALTVKVPLGYWMIFLLSIIGTLSKQIPILSRVDFLSLSIIPGVVLLLVSSQTGFNHHMRYVLPVLPFLFIWMSGVAIWFSAKNKFQLAGILVTIVSLLWAIVSSLIIFPHSLSYFNELAGGPMNGHKHLLHSNIDWGQDLLYLKNWITEHPEAQPMHLCYYGHIDPATLGVDYPLPPVSEKDDPNFHPPPGWYAISVNYLKGFEWIHKKNAYSYFEKYKPDATAGYSIYIYHVD